MQSRIYVIYKNNAYSRAYSGIQRCCGPLCIPRCAMCILKYTTHGAANTEHKGRLPTKHIASHNTNSTEGPLWGSPHICSKYREQLGPRRTIKVQPTRYYNHILLPQWATTAENFPGFARCVPQKESLSQIADASERDACLLLQCNVSLWMSVSVCEWVWSLCECV